ADSEPRQIGVAPTEASLQRPAGHAAERQAPHLDVVLGRAGRRQRSRRVEVLERELRLLLDQVREPLAEHVALALQLLEGLLALDRALLAGEARDVAAGAAVGRARVDERAAALVRAEVAGGRLVRGRRVLEGDGLIEPDEAGA